MMYWGIFSLQQAYCEQFIPVIYRAVNEFPFSLISQHIDLNSFL